MKIKVTAEHIKEGRRGSAFCCPVAIAVQDRTDAFCVEVGATIVALTQRSSRRSYELPDSVQGRIIKFDCTGEMVPFEFELPIEATP